MYGVSVVELGGYDHFWYLTTWRTWCLATVGGCNVFAMASGCFQVGVFWCYRLLAAVFFASVVGMLEFFGSGC